MTSNGPINLATLVFQNSSDAKSQKLLGKVKLLLRAVPRWQQDGLLADNPSFAVVVANLTLEGDYYSVWDDPEKLFGFAVSSGSKGGICTANALRMMRLSARIGGDTLPVVMARMFDVFRDEVDSSRDTDGHLPWGDLGEGGATRACWDGNEKTCVLVGVYGFTGTQNHWLACTVRNFLLMEITGG